MKSQQSPNHHFFSQKDCAVTNGMPPWVYSLLCSLPELLRALLTMKNPPSFERLQLVSMTIVLHDAQKKGDSSFKNIKLSYPSTTDFLVLEGDLMADDKKILSLSITYFLRGQRQFFRLPPDDDVPDVSMILPSITHADIETFLEKTKQYNSVLLDDSGLCGRPLFIPSHMMWWLMMYLIFSVSEHFRYKNFHARFFWGVPPSALCFSYKAGIDNFFARLCDDKNIFMSLKAS